VFLAAIRHVAPELRSGSNLTLPRRSRTDAMPVHGGRLLSGAGDVM
jgi:hypothetical protein